MGIYVSSHSFCIRAISGTTCPVRYKLCMASFIFFLRLTISLSQLLFTSRTKTKYMEHNFSKSRNIDEGVVRLNARNFQGQE